MRQRPFISVVGSDEGVAEVDEYPGQADDAVDADHGLREQQRHAHALEYGRDAPHVHRPRLQHLPQAQVQREQRYADQQRQDKELHYETC